MGRRGAEAVICVGVCLLTTQAFADWLHQTRDVGSGMGLMSAIVVDAQGFIHTSYLDAGAKDLRYTSNRSGSWKIDVVDAAGDTGYSNDIAVSAEGVVHISYRTGDGNVQYARLQGGVWTIESVVAGLAIPSFSQWHRDYKTSIALDAAGQPFIAFPVPLTASEPHETQLMVARRDGGVWLVKPVDDVHVPAFRCDLARDNDGGFQIAYSGAGAVRFARSTDGAKSWSLELIDDEVLHPIGIAIAADKAGAAHVTYAHYLQGLVERIITYATNADSGFAVTRVWAPMSANSTDIAIDVLGRKHVAWNSEAYPKFVAYMRFEKASVVDVFEAAVEEGAGHVLSLAIGADGLPFLSHYDYDPVLNYPAALMLSHPDKF